MRVFALILVVFGGLLVPESPVRADDAVEQPTLSYTRLLNRIHLRLLGRSPTMDEYQAIIDAPDDAARDAMIDKAIDEGLEILIPMLLNSAARLRNAN